MEKFFNTAGPVRDDLHYLLPPLERLADEDLLSLIGQQKYFVLHAPRQTGKTSALLGLMALLNDSGDYRCLYANVEAAQAARENVPAGMRTICRELATSARDLLGEPRLLDWIEGPLDRADPYGLLAELLSMWANASERPVVLFLDEIDSLVGDTLISVLRQLRSGYHKRPASFPQSVILCGVRDVRDYRIHGSSEKEVITGGSCFNIKAESLRLGSFTEEEVRRLYARHTEETGQRFDEEALRLAWGYTRGQPWLVNALGYEAGFKRQGVRDRSLPITAEALEAAKERLVESRATHLDQLADKLSEPRVRRVVAPIVLGQQAAAEASDRDLSYVEDLGLVVRAGNGPEIANGIYREVIPRELTFMTQVNLSANYRPAWYITDDHRLDLPKLLAAFQEFFRENSEAWVERFEYKEAGPHLLLQAFLQRVVNSGGRIDREYGLGRMRTDLLVRWPTDPELGFLGPVQKGVVELKLLHKSLELTIEQGLAQTAEYVQRTGAEEAHLVVFDRREGVTWDERVFVRREALGEVGVTVWGM